MVRLSDGCGMEPEFRAGDFVYVDPDEPAEPCRFVAVRPCPEDAVTDYTEIGALEPSIPANRTDGSVTFRLRPTNDATAEAGAVTSEQPVIAMSLLSSPTGHLTNLSTAPGRGAASKWGRARHGEWCANDGTT